VFLKDIKKLPPACYGKKGKNGVIIITYQKKKRSKDLIQNVS